MGDKLNVGAQFIAPSRLTTNQLGAMNCAPTSFRSLSTHNMVYIHEGAMNCAPTPLIIHANKLYNIRRENCHDI